MASGRESGATGKASHRGHGGHRGGIGVGGQEFDRRQHGVWARIRRNGESIAQRSRRSQRGDLGRWPGIRSATTWRLGENQAQRGKHRTEVTEVTEGGFGLVARNSIGDNHGVWARIGRNGESIAQRSRRSQREDLGWWPGIRSATTWRLGENRAQRGKHRTEVTEVTEGDLGWWPGIRSATRWRLGENRAQRGKHRTEATEEGLGSAARNSIGDNHGVWARIGRNGESIARRSPREIAGGGRNLIGEITASGRETAQRAILFAWVLTVDAKEFTEDLPSSAPISPSVASVTSVRCYLFGRVLALTPRSSLRTYRPAPQFPPPWPL